MKPTKDGNQSTHAPNASKKVDVRSLYKLINEILNLSATTTVQGATRDQAVLDSHLKSFKNSSCSQEMVRTVHKVSSQLLCNCWGGGDEKSTTVAVLNTLSHYSWEAKMVIVLAAFAGIYGESWMMAEQQQIDPLADSIKLLRQLPDKSKLFKIRSLINAMLTLTNTILDFYDDALPDNISIHIQTAVSCTVGSLVFCTSHIIGFDHEYTEDEDNLSEVTEKVVGMNSHLGQLLSECNAIRLTIDENAIRSTHSPEVNNVDVSPLHKFINETFMPCTPQHEAVFDSHLQSHKNSSEPSLQELAKTVHKICLQLSFKCWEGGDANSTTVALFNTLSHYSWEAKLVLALASFAVIYGETSLIAEQTSPLANSMKLLIKLPDKSKLSKIRFLMDAMVKVTNRIVEIVQVDDSPLPENISTQIQIAVSWTAGGIVFCTTQIMGFIGLDDEYTEYGLYKLTKNVYRMNTDLGELLDTWRQSIAEKKKRKAEEDILNAMPLPENMDQVVAALRNAGLKSSNLILGIDFTSSNTIKGRISFDNRSLHDIRGTRNPYQQAIEIICKTFAPFAKDDKQILCYGFGDDTAKDEDVFSFQDDDIPCQGFEEVLRCYMEIVSKVKLAGPTSYAPVIEAAIDIVEKSGGEHHVLVIIADEQVTESMDEGKTIDSIVTASSYALSIVLVGVGDGPWIEMEKFADNIPAGRKFDNFQFVQFHDIMSNYKDPTQKEAAFAFFSLMKIPMQYKASMELGLLGHTTGRAKKVVPIPPPFRR